MCNIIFLQKPALNKSNITFANLSALNAMIALSFEKNPDGSGSYDGKDITKSTGPMLVDSGFDLSPGDWLLLHYRKATVGGINFENIQPIVNEGRIITSMTAHNGTLDGTYQKTDSIWLANEIDAALKPKLGDEGKFYEKTSLDKIVYEAIQSVVKELRGAMSVFYFFKYSGSWYKYYFRNDKRNMYTIRFGSFWMMATNRYDSINCLKPSETKEVKENILYRIEPGELVETKTLEFPKPQIPSYSNKTYSYRYGYDSMESLFTKKDEKPKAPPRKFLMTEFMCFDPIFKMEGLVETYLAKCYDSTGKERYFQRQQFLDLEEENDGFDAEDEIGVFVVDLSLFAGKTSHQDLQFHMLSFYEGKEQGDYDLFPLAPDEAEEMMRKVSKGKKKFKDSEIYEALHMKGIFKTENFEIKELTEVEYMDMVFAMESTILDNTRSIS